MRIKFPLRRRDAPTAAWTKCPSCESQIFNRQLERNLRELWEESPDRARRMARLMEALTNLALK